MATAKVWKNVDVKMQSAIAAAKTITAISKASPAVVSCTAHGYSNGDIVFVLAEGMFQVDARVFRVASVTTDSFALESEDSTEFDDFISGTVAKVTLGTTITTATTISSSGGDFAMIDKTTIHQNTRSEMPGLPNAINYSMEHIWDPSDAGLKAMKVASELQQRRVFKFTIGDAIVLFAGYVGCTLLPGGQAQDLVKTSSVFTLDGTPTYY